MLIARKTLGQLWIWHTDLFASQLAHPDFESASDVNRPRSTALQSNAARCASFAWPLGSKNVVGRARVEVSQMADHLTQYVHQFLQCYSARAGGVKQSDPCSSLPLMT